MGNQFGTTMEIPETLNPKSLNLNRTTMETKVTMEIARDKVPVSRRMRHEDSQATQGS